MDERSDMLLLRDWRDHRDRQAVGELIRRHIDFVLNTARRQVGNDIHLAEDIAQAVFILFLQKAHRIKSEAAMAGWLFVTTRFAASNARRMISRREHYERAAAAKSDEYNVVEHDSDLEMLLNEAIAHLPRMDREYVVLSYLQQKTHKQVAESFGVSEDAARMHVSRALRKLREFFLARGVANASEGTMASLLLFSKFSTASTALIESTLNIATLSQSAAGSTSAMTIAKGVTNMMYAMKVKVAAASMVLLFGGWVTAQVVERALSRQAGLVVTGQLQNAVPQDSSAVSLGDGVSVTFAGISKYPQTPQSWRSLDGKPIAQPLPKGFTIVQLAKDFSGPAAQVLVRVHGPDDAEVKISKSNNAPGMSESFKTAASQDQYLLEAFALDPGEQFPQIRIDIADGPWQTATRLDRQQWEKEPWTHVREGVSAKGENFFLTPAFERDGNAAFCIAAEKIDGQVRLIANDINGLQHIGVAKDGASSDNISMSAWALDIPAVMVTSLEIQTRPFNKHVTAEDITFDPAKPTTPRIVVKGNK